MEAGGDPPLHAHLVTTGIQFHVETDSACAGERNGDWFVTGATKRVCAQPHGVSRRSTTDRYTSFWPTHALPLITSLLPAGGMPAPPHPKMLAFPGDRARAWRVASPEVDAATSMARDYSAETEG